MSAQLDHFSDGQLRRYITQLVRMMSGFSYEDSQGDVVTVPTMYGDLTRQVANIIRGNSENTIPNAPRMAVYVTGLELDTSRLADSSYTEKKNIVEREYDSQGREYLNTEGRSYTVERLMPTPYTLTVNVDLWSTNTDQKLQILEQILMLFNPSLELQTNDNYLDWTSLSAVYLDSVNWSSRTIPQGTETEIDVASLTFTTPIWISPPAKVKRLGVITDIVTRIHGSKQDLVDGTRDIDFDLPEGSAKFNSEIFINSDGDVERTTGYSSYETQESVLAILKTNYKNTNLLVMDNTAQLIPEDGVPLGWREFLEAFPYKFEQGASQLRLERADMPTAIVGTFYLSSDEKIAEINWDVDSMPTDTVLPGPGGDKSKIDYIIDPQKTDPRNLQGNNPRVLILNDIGDDDNTDGASAWKNQDNTDFVAKENDIIEWSGANWQVVLAANEQDSTVFTTNLNTGVQYKLEDNVWSLAFEGEYPNGSWWIAF